MKDNIKTLNKALAVLLKNIRNDKGLTMRVLAEKLKTPHSYIGKIEQQDRRIDVAEFIEYCEALSKDPIEVFTKLVKER